MRIGENVLVATYAAKSLPSRAGSSWSHLGSSGVSAKSSGTGLNVSQPAREKPSGLGKANTEGSLMSEDAASCCSDQASESKWMPVLKGIGARGETRRSPKTR